MGISAWESILLRLEALIVPGKWVGWSQARSWHLLEAVLRPRHNTGYSQELPRGSGSITEKSRKIRSLLRCIVPEGCIDNGYRSSKSLPW